MASANHSEQKGQDSGEERKGPSPWPCGPPLSQPCPQGVDPSPEEASADPSGPHTEVTEGVGWRQRLEGPGTGTRKRAASRQVVGQDR